MICNNLEIQLSKILSEDQKALENPIIPLQYYCLENPLDGRAWWATVHRITKSQT